MRNVFKSIPTRINRCIQRFCSKVISLFWVIADGKENDADADDVAACPYER